MICCVCKGVVESVVSAGEERAMHPPSDNPFQTPGVLEQVHPVSQGERLSEDEMPGMVALGWMFFLFAATIHAMASLYLRQPWFGLAALCSMGIGFAILYPSALTWGIGLGYACLMTVIMLGYSIVTAMGQRPPTIFEMPPLVLYMLIIALLVQTSRHYYFDKVECEHPSESS